MSKNHRHIPYPVAYKRVTGKDLDTGDVRRVSIEEALEEARSNPEYSITKNHRENIIHLSSEKNKVTKIILLGSETITYSFTVYPMSRYKVNGRGEAIHTVKESLTGNFEVEGSINEPTGFILEKDQDMIKLLRQMNVTVTDTIVAFNDLWDNQMIPITHDDGSIMFYHTHVTELTPVYSPEWMLGMENHVLDFSMTVTVTVMHPDQLDVTVVTEPNDENNEVTIWENLQIMRMVWGSSEYPGYSPGDYGHASRRTADRNDLVEAVKMINGGVDPHDLDVCQKDSPHNYFW